MIHAPAILTDALLLIAAFPLIYYLLACFAAGRFLRGVHESAGSTPFQPPVSILKPVHGVDFASYDNYASFCTQDYPKYEILFAVNELNDPATAVVQRIIAAFPERRIRLLSGAQLFGANRKVNNLALLASEAQHEILVMSDGDIRVGKNYLRNVVAPFQNPRTGAVTSFYRGIAQPNIWAELEAVGASSSFFPGVMMAAWTEGVKFALGASIAISKSWLKKIGGFEEIAAFLADDYEIGHRVAQAGGRVVLCHETVATMYPAQTAHSFWDHQMRWSRTVRLCRPASYAALLFTQGLPWAIAAALIAPAGWISIAYLGLYLLLRLQMAGIVGILAVKDQVLSRRLYLVPVFDAIHFVVWVASFFSNRIVWGDTEYRVYQGKMQPVATRATTTPSARAAS
jgi:ceramide glucosyltransferase